MDDKVLKIKYTHSPDYTRTFVTGCTAAVSPTGMIEINYFEDRGILPTEATASMDGIEFSNNADPLEFERFVKCSVLMQPDIMPGFIELTKTVYQQYLDKTAAIKERSHEQRNE